MHHKRRLLHVSKKYVQYHCSVRKTMKCIGISLMLCKKLFYTTYIQQFRILHLMYNNMLCTKITYCCVKERSESEFQYNNY